MYLYCFYLHYKARVGGLIIVCGVSVRQCHPIYKFGVKWKFLTYLVVHLKTNWARDMLVLTFDCERSIHSNWIWKYFKNQTKPFCILSARHVEISLKGVDAGKKWQTCLFVKPKLSNLTWQYCSSTGNLNDFAKTPKAQFLLFRCASISCTDDRRLACGSPCYKPRQSWICWNTWAGKKYAFQLW